MNLRLRKHQVLLLGIGITMVLGCASADQGSQLLDPPIKAAPAEANPSIVDLRVKPVEPPTAAIPAPSLDSSLGDFKLTYYWVASESKTSKGTQAIVDKNCKRIAKVSKKYKRRLTLEGSGKLKDGRMVTTAGGCRCGAPCFWVTDGRHQWGAGVSQRPLAPFRSIAVDPKQIKIGTSIYVAELDGLTMPGSGEEGGFVHDGCVVADDRGGGVKGKQIDFFAARRSHYRNFFKRHKINKVSVYSGGERCRAQAGEHDSLRTSNSGSS